jgi:hypothetical protein
MTDEKTDDLSKMDEFDLVLLAMKAFLYIRKEAKATDEQLLRDILHWFDLMTERVDWIEVEDVEYCPLDHPPTGGLH